MENSAIQTYLKKIGDAVYGKDVREAIYKAIEQCYSDVSNPTLNQKAFEEQVKTKLQEYIDKGILTNMTIPDGSITQEKLSSDIKFGIDDGEVTAKKLSGVIVNEPIIEYEGYYLENETGVMTANSAYCVTRLIPVKAGQKIFMGRRSYGNSYDKKRTFAFYQADGTTVVKCTYDKSYLIDGAETDSDTWGVVPADGNIAYLRFTVYRSAGEADAFFSNFDTDSISYTDGTLNKTLGAMVSGNLLEKSVDVKNFNFIRKKYYNKAGYHNGKVYDRPLYVKNYLKSSKLNGIYISDLVTGVKYRSNVEINIQKSISLICYDKQGNLIGVSNEDIFESYEKVTEGYVTHWEFTLKENIGKVYLNVHGVSEYNDKECLICVCDEYEYEKNVDNVEYECTSKEFSDIVQQSISYYDVSSLKGKVFIALGDSYTKGMDSQLQNLCTKLGMILDNRGIVSSSVCGDIQGNKGYRPMWKRADEIVSDYTAGYVINGVTYKTSDVAIINFMGGANDGFGIETWIGTGIHDMDTNHIYGSMNHIFNVLLETFTSAKVICTTQPSSFNRTADTNITDESARVLGFSDASEYKKLTDVQLSNYAMALKENAIKEVAWSYGVPINDVFTEFPTMFNPSNRTKYWSGDKLHLTTSGYQLVVDSIYSKIKELFRA